VPATKPSWTALVKSDADCGSIKPCARSYGTTAEAENHSAIAATWLTVMIVMAAARRDNMSGWDHCRAAQRNSFIESYNGAVA
jgi:hypothetical protein